MTFGTWVLVGLLIGLLLYMGICYLISAKNESFLEHFAKKAKDDKIYCRFYVYDLQTDEKYAYGIRRFDVSKFVCTGTVKAGLRLIPSYTTQITIRGRECEVIIYADKNQKEDFYFLTPAYVELITNAESTY